MAYLNKINVDSVDYDIAAKYDSSGNQISTLISGLESDISSEESRATSAENSLSSRISSLEGKSDSDTTNSSVTVSVSLSTSSGTVSVSVKDSANKTVSDSDSILAATTSRAGLMTTSQVSTLNDLESRVTSLENGSGSGSGDGNTYNTSVSASYSSASSTGSITVSVTDTNSTKSGSVTIPAATTSSAGLMTASQVADLNTALAGSGSGTSYYNTATALTYTTASSTGTLLTSVTDQHGTVTGNVTIPAATTSAAGLMTSSQASLLSNIGINGFWYGTQSAYNSLTKNSSWLYVIVG